MSRNLSRKIGLVAQIQMHQQSAPETHFKAISWPFYCLRPRPGGGPALEPFLCDRSWGQNLRDDHLGGPHKAFCDQAAILYPPPTIPPLPPVAEVFGPRWEG